MASLVVLRALLAERDDLAQQIGTELVRLAEVEHVRKLDIAEAIGRHQSEIWRRVELWSGRLGSRPPAGQGKDLGRLVSMVGRYERLPGLIDNEMADLTATVMSQADLAREIGVSRQAVEQRIRRHRRRQGEPESW